MSELCILDLKLMCYSRVRYPIMLKNMLGHGNALDGSEHPFKTRQAVSQYLAELTVAPWSTYSIKVMPWQSKTRTI